MDETKQPKESMRGFAWAQLRLCGALLFIMGLCETLPQLVMCNDQIIVPGQLAKWKATNTMFADVRFFDDWDGTLVLLYDKLPHADFSKGGVYFFGASDIANGVPVFELPPPEQSFVMNCAMGGTTHTHHFQFIRYLIEKRGLLEAGPKKTLVIIGLFFGDACHLRTIDLDNGTAYRFNRFGLYHYDLKDGIDDVHISGPTRLMRTMKMRHETFFWWANRIVTNGSDRALSPPKTKDPEAIYAEWNEVLGRDWKAGMDEEVGQLSQMMDFLQSKHVRVIALSMPKGPWFDQYEPAERYHDLVWPLLRRKKIPIVDLGRAVPPTCFNDSCHLNYVGVHEVKPKVIGLAEDFLRSTGALPAP